MLPRAIHEHMASIGAMVAAMSRAYQLMERVLPESYRSGMLGQASMPFVLERVYVARGVTHASELDAGLKHMLVPHAMGGIVEACQLLQKAISLEWPIVIVGDFDADGACGTAVAVRGLRKLGAKQVGYRVPNRFKHGYGLSEALVSSIVGEAQAANTPAPKLLITVDNGTSSVAGVLAAKAAGMHVIVTDHHLPGLELPPADAIVNPNLQDDPFESKNLCGAGVMFYLLMALRAHFRSLGLYQNSLEPNLVELIDLVALATVADLVPLDRNNRILVEQGLRRIRAGAATMGIRALIATSGTDVNAVTASDFGFRLGPRINAAGRLEDMSVGIECLLTDNPSIARQLAEQLGALNSERRELQAQMQHEAFAILEQLNIAPEDSKERPAVIIVADESWHQGVVGLVASKLAERFHRPAIALAPAEDGWRGSARSIAGFHLRDALALFDAKHPGILQRFGGHAMAAGLSIASDKLEPLKKQAPAVFASLLANELLLEQIYFDGDLPSNAFNVQLAQAIRFGGPWGQAFPEPQFRIEADIRDVQTLSGGHLRCRVRWGQALDWTSAVYFSPPITADQVPERASLLVQVSVDEFRGLASARLLIRRVLA
jgi:single-stranded-DNA-specific exonuclease